MVKPSFPCTDIGKNLLYYSRKHPGTSTYCQVSVAHLLHRKRQNTGRLRVSRSIRSHATRIVYENLQGVPLYLRFDIPVLLRVYKFQSLQQCCRAVSVIARRQRVAYRWCRNYRNLPGLQQIHHEETTGTLERDIAFLIWPGLCSMVMGEMPFVFVPFSGYEASFTTRANTAAFPATRDVSDFPDRPRFLINSEWN